MDKKFIGMSIKEARNRIGMTQSQLATALNVSERTIVRIENGYSDIKMERLKELASILDTSEVVLLGGNAKAYVPDDEVESMIDLGEKIMKSNVDLHMESNLESLRIEKNTLPIAVLSSMSSICCGDGYDTSYVDEEVIRHELIPEEWLRGHPKSPLKPYIVYVDGDSMEPKLDNGERILVNPNEREIINERVYVVQWNDRKKVRKIILQRNGDIILRAYNPAYKDDVVLAEDAEYTFEVCGRVVRYLGLDRPAD